MCEPRKRIGELLVEGGLVTVDQVQQALVLQQEQGGRTVENLIHLGYLDTETFAAFLAGQPGIASLALSRYALRPEVTSLIPGEFAEAHQLIPIDRMGNLLTVGMACPVDAATIARAEEMTGLRIKAVLCSIADIVAAIEGVYGLAADSAEARAGNGKRAAEQLASGIRLGNLPAMIRAVDTLPTLPETVNAVRHALEDDEVSVADVAGVILRDPPASARLLSVANSAAFALSQQIETVEHAMSYLGLEETYALVTSLAVLDLFEEAGRWDVKGFWSESQDVAAAAVAVGRACGMRQTARAYSVALIHDIGRLVLATLRPNQYGSIDPALRNQALVAAEEEVFGLAHPEAGFLLAETWRLPLEMAETIRFHHDPGKAQIAPDFIAIAQVATSLCDLRDEAPEEAKAALRRECGDALELLGLSEEVSNVLLTVVRGLREDVAETDSEPATS